MDRNYWTGVLGKRLNRRRVLATTGSATFAAAILAACGGGDETKDAASLVAEPRDTSKEAKRGGTLLDFRNQDIFTFDGQALLTGGIGPQRIFSRLLRLKYAPLQPLAPEYQGDLADSWEFSPDRLRMTVKLRNMTWHPIAPVNGRRIDAQDIATSWQRWESIGVTRGNYSTKVNPDAPIESVTALDDRTIAIKLSQPVSSILGLLATANAGMFFMPKEADESYDPRKTGIGSSAFYVSNFLPSARLSLKRHDGWYEAQKTYIDDVTEFIIPEYAAGLSQFRSGALQTFAVRPEDILTVKREVPVLNLNVEDPAAHWGIFRFGWNPARKTPFRDKRLRQALALSMDRDLWLDTFYNLKNYAAAGIALESYLHTSVMANTAGLYAGKDSYWMSPRDKDFGPNAKYYQRNVAEAKKLVAAAGFATGVDTELVYPLTPGYGDEFIKQAQVITDMANEVGIKLAPNNPNFNIDFRPKFGDSQGDFDGAVIRFGLARGIYDPVEVAFYEFTPSASASYSGFFSDNSTWKQGDSSYTTMLKQARQEFDEKKRIALLREFQRMDAENQYQPSFPGTASGLSLTWPAIRNYNVYKQDPGAGNALARTNIWLDTTQPPFKGA